MNLSYYAIIAGLTLLAGAIARAESDLPYEVRETQQWARPSEKQSARQSEADHHANRNGAITDVAL